MSTGQPGEPPQPKLAVDRELPIPVGVQLRGQIEYGIASGEFAAEERLPSVRELARALSVAPVTVSNVYKELQERDLIETLPGKGTFVKQRNATPASERNQLALHRAVDDLLAQTAALGFSPAEVSGVVNAKLGRLRHDVRPLRLTLVGLFEDATRAYAANIRWHLRAEDTLDSVTFAQLEQAPTLLQRVKSSDLVLTFGHRERDVRQLVGDEAHVVPLKFIPATTTRTNLAALDPRTLIAGVATFPEFVLTMRAGIRRFSAHVAEVRVMSLEDPELPALLAWSQVVVYATGAEHVLAQLPPRVDALEYRHMPEPTHLETTLLPLLEGLRHQPEQQTEKEPS